MTTLLRILRLGMPESKDHLEARRVLLLNFFFLVSTVTLFAALLESILVSEPIELQAANAIVLLAMALVPIIARKNSYYGAAWLMFISNCTVFFFSNVQGFESGTYIFFFPIFFANGWLMDFRKPAYSVLLVSMTLLGISLVALLRESFFDFALSPEQQEFSFAFALIASAFLMAVNTLVIVWLNYRRNQELETEIEHKEEATKNLSQALKEKEILIAEIHHRVKNNLAVVRGLLNMQMNSTNDELTRATLRESVSRVTAMALIHQKLYTNRNADSIDLQKYITELAGEVAASFQIDGENSPKVSVHVENTSLDLNLAVPCALILNELLTNSFKHAFGNGSGRSAQINVTMAPDNQRPGFIKLSVEDNGKGMARDFHPESDNTLGMTIIQSLSEQIDGTFSITGEPGKGTQATVTFPAASS